VLLTGGGGGGGGGDGGDGKEGNINVCTYHLTSNT
jgi:hypothetical protein